MPRKTTDIIFRAVFVVLLGVVVTREVWHPAADEKVPMDAVCAASGLR